MVGIDSGTATPGPLWGGSITGSNTTWAGWNQQYSIEVSLPQTWQAWNCGYTVVTLTGTTGQTTWADWNLAFANQAAYGLTAAQEIIPTIWGAWNGIRETEEQRRAREAQQAALRTQQEEAMRQRSEEQKAAKQKAEKLLLKTLNWRQRRQYRRDRSFCLRSEKGNRYRIEFGSHGNVKLIDKKTGRVRTSYCAAPIGNVPAEDAMLAQMLMLKTDEAAFTQVANATRYMN